MAITDRIDDGHGVDNGGHKEAPMWAVALARGSLRCGQTAERIETTLVRRGLTPAQSVNAVDRAAGELIEMQSNGRSQIGWWRWCSRLGSLIVVGALAMSLGTEMAMYLLGLLLPLACIWFSRALGRYVGPWGEGYISRTTPAVIVAAGGWVLLLIGSMVILVLER